LIYLACIKFHII